MSSEINQSPELALSFTYFPQELPWAELTLFQPCSQIYWSHFKKPNCNSNSKCFKDPKEYSKEELSKMILLILAKRLYFDLAQPTSDIELLTQIYLEQKREKILGCLSSGPSKRKNHLGRTLLIIVKERQEFIQL